MPTYRYKCPSCEHQFDVVKSFREIDELEKCPSCSRGSIEGSNRVIGAVMFYGEKQDEPFYSIPLGKMVKSKKEMRGIAKARGWEEVGSTDVTKQLESADKILEQKTNDRYKEFFAPIEING